MNPNINDLSKLVSEMKKKVDIAWIYDFSTFVMNYLSKEQVVQFMVSYTMTVESIIQEGLKVEYAVEDGFKLHDKMASNRKKHQMMLFMYRHCPYIEKNYQSEITYPHDVLSIYSLDPKSLWYVYSRWQKLHSHKVYFTSIEQLYDALEWCVDDLTIPLEKYYRNNPDLSLMRSDFSLPVGPPPPPSHPAPLPLDESLLTGLQLKIVRLERDIEQLRNELRERDKKIEELKNKLENKKTLF
jgi:hypothetical protein